MFCETIFIRTILEILCHEEFCTITKKNCIFLHKNVQNITSISHSLISKLGSCHMLSAGEGPLIATSVVSLNHCSRYSDTCPESISISGERFPLLHSLRTYCNATDMFWCLNWQKTLNRTTVIVIVKLCKLYILHIFI